MDRLRAPGGCPWDAAQDHISLVQYLLEEAYEVAEAIETGDRAALREELGDLLLQVVFHAAIAQEEPEPFDLDDVASDVADKLIRRHPHVYSGAHRTGELTAEQSYSRWDRIKAEEKARTSVLDGIPIAQPAVARAQKVLGRARRGGLDVGTLTAAHLAPAAEEDESAQVSAAIGGRLLSAILDADSAGIDAEAALREVTRRVESAIRDREETVGVAESSPTTPTSPSSASTGADNKEV
jgi:XTP/dITP diphosphohydrolase